MHVHRVAAVLMLLFVASLASAQQPAAQAVQKVSTPRSVYVWKAGPPTDSAAGLRRWRIEGAAGSSIDATKKALGKISAAAPAMLGDTMDMLVGFLTSSTPIAPGFSPWGVVPQKNEDVLLLEKGQMKPQGTPVSAPARFEAGRNGGWQIKIDGVPWLFAALVYPAKDGSGLIVEGPFAVLTPTAATAVLSSNTVPAIVVGRIRYPEDRWSSIGGGYTIKGGGMEFDATGVSLMVGTQYTFDAAAAAAPASAASAAPTPTVQPAAAPAAPPPPIQPAPEPLSSFHLPAELANLKIPSGKKFVIAQKDVSVEPTGRVQVTLSLTGATSPGDAASITGMEVFYLTKHANLKTTDKDDATGPVGMRRVRDQMVANTRALSGPTITTGVLIDFSDRTGWPVGGYSSFFIERASEAEVVGVGLVNPHPHTDQTMEVGAFVFGDRQIYGTSTKPGGTPIRELHPSLDDLAPRALGVVLYDKKGPVSNFLWVTLPR